jgi:broad specificity phosphatase PhoE
MRLLLIRHGESAHAQLGLVAGERGCPGLTPRGRDQARALRRRLETADPRPDVLLSSTIPRARETAVLIAPAVPSGIRFDRNLGELHPGEGDGLTVAEFTARYGSADPQAHPDRPLSPGGESWNEFTRRVRATLDGLPAAYPGQTVAAVTHAAFIVWAIITLFGIPRPGTRARFDPHYASVTQWEYSERDRCWMLVSFNDTGHLAG